MLHRGLLIILFLFFLVAKYHRCDELHTGKGLLVIPGLGSASRLQTVRYNLEMLMPFFQTQQLGCLIYIYAPRNVTSFWSMTDDLSYLRRFCELVDHPNGRVTANLYLLQPMFVKNYSYIFILLDDCKLLGDRHFPLDRVLRIMSNNQLTVASPRVIGANKGGGQQFRTIMQRLPMKGTVGYISTFVEIFAWIVTPSAYRALWNLLYPPVNPYGWGYDMWYDNYGLNTVPGHKMGIISAVEVKHDQDFSAPNGGRTETASMKEKWQAVMQQEIFYKKFMSIDLRKCRKESRMVNSSWNGPVLGYLFD